MGIFNSEYTIEVNKSVDDTKALFEKYFKDMSTVGYSMSTVIMNSDYGRKKFTGSVGNDGVYSARLINANGTDALYRSSLLNKITFSGDSFHTKVNVFCQYCKIRYYVYYADCYCIAVLCIIAYEHNLRRVLRCIVGCWCRISVVKFYTPADSKAQS